MWILASQKAAKLEIFLVKLKLGSFLAGQKAAKLELNQKYF